ncbi:ribosome hibernation factor-recruiting GTPase MRF [Pseudonocardia pini]|uniref:ribosome hibernation factor-recruiting GTPase MRF n=1 Tax=Pseudonocardia pini TaxID=2758030 RepID=UPI0015F008B7|nr:GTP-binding protein [Pseudonocardia pini]
MTELLVVTGLHAVGVERVIGRIRAADPDAVVLHHDLRDVGAGLVRRRMRDRRIDTLTELRLAHGCVSCTLREDLLPTLRDLAGRVERVVLHLDPALEPEQVCWALRHVLVDGVPVGDLVDLRGVVAAVDAETWLDDATGDEPVAERGLADLPDDERTVAQLAVGQAEFADLLVHTGAADAWRHARVDAVLARLAPTAMRARVADLDGDQVLLRRAHAEARRGRPDDVHAPLLRGAPPLETDCGVRMLVFSARRPFHPDRLHEAIDLLLEGIVRVRGRVWLATRPDDVLWLESAGGGLRIGGAGEWLAGRGAAAWEQAAADRRALASLGWHPRFGDRAQDVVVLAHALDADGLDAVGAALQGALLTEAELAAPWSTLPDPFGFHHTDPCGEPAVPESRLGWGEER